jgi:hypothetical protein
LLQPEKENGYEERNCFVLGGIGDSLVCSCTLRRH